MTHITLQPNEFVIKLDKTAEEIILKRETPKIQIINPHKEGESDYNAHMMLKMILDRLSPKIIVRK